MKKKYLGLAVTSTLAFLMLATSAFAVNNADLLDGLDSTDFATKTDLDTAVVNLEIADANPVLPINYKEPYNCETMDAGAIILTSLFTTCVCDGTDWVLTADGTTSCDLPETVTSAGQVWMDRNLGASQVATSSTDEAAYGDLYQWGRGADGHEKRSSSTTSTLSTTVDPGHGNFIITNDIEPSNWLTPTDETLWQGVSGTNNPCPAGFRIPTETEWSIEINEWGTPPIPEGAFQSPLKITMGGVRMWTDGTMGQTTYGQPTGGYWSSTSHPTIPDRIQYTSLNGGSDPYVNRWDFGTYRATGLSVRCIMD